MSQASMFMGNCLSTFYQTYYKEWQQSSCGMVMNQIIHSYVQLQKNGTGIIKNRSPFLTSGTEAPYKD